MAVARVTENDVLTGEITAMPVEGAIMPETYVFPRGRTRQKMLDEMQAAQTKMLDELWSKRSVSDTVKTKEQAVTLASIVEKETAIPEERPLIASVFHNRLKQGMRLQSDPTIIYGLVGGKGKLDRGLTKDDLDSDTAYNTYKIDGLPPDPLQIRAGPRSKRCSIRPIRDISISSPMAPAAMPLPRPWKSTMPTWPSGAP